MAKEKGRLDDEAALDGRKVSACRAREDGSQPQALRKYLAPSSPCPQSATGWPGVPRRKAGRRADPKPGARRRCRAPWGSEQTERKLIRGTVRGFPLLTAVLFAGCATIYNPRSDPPDVVAVSPAPHIVW